MKLLFPILAIAIVSAVVQNFAPWWSIAIVAFIISYLLRLKPGLAFLAAFLGVFILWAGVAARLDFGNDHILSQRIATLFPLKGNYWLLLLLTGVIGGLVSGLAGLSGALLRSDK